MLRDVAGRVIKACGDRIIKNYTQESDVEVLSSWVKVPGPGKNPDFSLHLCCGLIRSESLQATPTSPNTCWQSLIDHPATGTTFPTLYDSCVGIMTSDFKQFYRSKGRETWPILYRTYPRSSKEGSTFYLVILRPWDLFRPGGEPAVSRSADRCSPNWANRTVVESLWKHKTWNICRCRSSKRLQ